MKRILRNVLCAVARALGVTAWLLSRRRGSVVLCYHRVNARSDPLRAALPPRLLSEHFAWLGKRFRIATAAEIARDPGAATRRAAITFDDGHADNLAEALPCLLAAGVPATMFPLTGTCVPWTERVHRIPGIVCEAVKRRLKELESGEREREIERLVRTHGQVADGEELLAPGDLGPWVDAGNDVGAHTRTHPILTHCGDDEMEEEIAGSRRDLENVLGRAPDLFAYPGGAFDDRTARCVEAAGFAAAFTTGGGWVDDSSPRFALPRIDVRPDATVAVLVAEVSGLLPTLRRLRRST